MKKKIVEYGVLILFVFSICCRCINSGKTKDIIFSKDQIHDSTEGLESSLRCNFLNFNTAAGVILGTCLFLPLCIDTQNIDCGPYVPIKLSVGCVSLSECAFIDNGFDMGIKCWGNGGSGRLGNGNGQNKGDNPGEMGNNLPFLNLGSDIEAVDISNTQFSSCALLNTSQIKCWGNGVHGNLGKGSLSNIGALPGQMGDNLTVVNLGDGISVTQIASGGCHHCALLNTSLLKCWGDNIAGGLGLGDTNNRGDVPGEMGNNLTSISVGTGVEVSEISLGDFHSCVRTSIGEIKCWGNNIDGQLGIENTVPIGTFPGGMGDNLTSVDLGTGLTAIQVAAGGYHVCALLNNNGVKCWGMNTDGQTGNGDSTGSNSLIGDEPGELGDDLAFVDLGTGLFAQKISSGRDHTCALLNTNQVKCWGRNLQGQLGQGDNTSRGITSGQMGDDLDPIDLGTGLTAIDIYANGMHTCALLNTNELKCWGANGWGIVGIGNTTGSNLNIGDEPDEMGDNLPVIDFGFTTCDPTADPTSDPTSDPTVDPTTDPTADPTKDPTTDPTVDPTTDPTADPTTAPSLSPTLAPSFSPSYSPSAAPTPVPVCERCLGGISGLNTTNSFISYDLITTATDPLCFNKDTLQSITIDVPICDFDTEVSISSNCISDDPNSNVCSNFSFPITPDSESLSIGLADCGSNSIQLNVSITNTILEPGGNIIIGEEMIGCDTCNSTFNFICRPKRICECFESSTTTSLGEVGIDYVFEQTSECFDQFTIKHLTLDLPECLTGDDLDLNTNCLLLDSDPSIFCESNDTAILNFSNPLSITLSGCPLDIFYLNVTTDKELIGFRNNSLTTIQQSSMGGSNFKSCDGCIDLPGFRCLTAAPTYSPTDSPTHAPTVPPTPFPTGAPTQPPTHTPTHSPTYPSSAPTDAPSLSPTLFPTAAPTYSPTDSPTSAPSFPTGAPTYSPTKAPTDIPTITPTAPTNAPTDSPTEDPTPPSSSPTATPSAAPTPPSMSPTYSPSLAPSDSPMVDSDSDDGFGFEESVAIWVPILGLLILLCCVAIIILSICRYYRLKEKKGRASLILYQIQNTPLAET